MCGGVRSEAWSGTYGAVPPESAPRSAKLNVVWGNNATVTNLHLVRRIGQRSMRQGGEAGGDVAHQDGRSRPICTWRRYRNRRPVRMGAGGGTGTDGRIRRCVHRGEPARVRGVPWRLRVPGRAAAAACGLPRGAGSRITAISGQGPNRSCAARRGNRPGARTERSAAQSARQSRCQRCWESWARAAACISQDPPNAVAAAGSRAAQAMRTLNLLDVGRDFRRRTSNCTTARGIHLQP